MLEGLPQSDCSISKLMTRPSPYTEHKPLLRKIMVRYCLYVYCLFLHMVIWANTVSIFDVIFDIPVLLLFMNYLQYTKIYSTQLHFEVTNIRQ